MLRLIESLGGLAGRSGFDNASAIGKARPRSTQAPALRASGSEALRHIALAPFETIEIDLPADCFWRPGPPSVRLIAPESFLKALRMEIAGRRLTLRSSSPLLGARPRFELSSARLVEAHASGEARFEAEDVEAGRLIATARGSACVSLAGEAAEAHLETMENGVIDAASLLTFIAVADLCGHGIILLRAREAIEADLRDDSQLLTIGSPRILETRRHRPPSA